MTTGLLLHHGVRWHGHTPWIIAGIAHWFVVQCHVDAKWSARHWKCLACCGWGACCCCIPRSRPSHNLLLRSSHHNLHNLSHNLRNHNHLRFERRKSWVSGSATTKQSWHTQMVRWNPEVEYQTHFYSSDATSTSRAATATAAYSTLSQWQNQHQKSKRPVSPHRPRTKLCIFRC